MNNEEKELHKFAKDYINSSKVMERSLLHPSKKVCANLGIDWIN